MRTGANLIVRTGGCLQQPHCADWRLPDGADWRSLLRGYSVVLKRAVRTLAALFIPAFALVHLGRPGRREAAAPRLGQRQLALELVQVAGDDCWIDSL